MLHSIYTMTTKHYIISVKSHLSVGSGQLCFSYLSSLLFTSPYFFTSIVIKLRRQPKFEHSLVSTFQKGSNLLSSQGWIHWVPVLLCSPAYDLFICEVEHSDNPPHPTLLPTTPHLSNQKYRRRPYGDEARCRKLNQLCLQDCFLIKCYSMAFTLHTIVLCTVRETGLIRQEG